MIFFMNIFVFFFVVSPQNLVGHLLLPKQYYPNFKWSIVNRVLLLFLLINGGSFKITTNEKNIFLLYKTTKSSLLLIFSILKKIIEFVTVYNCWFWSSSGVWGRWSRRYRTRRYRTRIKDNSFLRFSF